MYWFSTSVIVLVSKSRPKNCKSLLQGIQLEKVENKIKCNTILF